MITYFKTPRLFRILFPNRTWGFSSTNKIYLTFDDGPHPEITPWLLDELARRGMRATFFCLGENINVYPQVVNRIVVEGHVLAYHGYTHKRNSNRSIKEIRSDLSSAPQVLTKCYYRPPYGRLSLLKSLGIPSDWRVVMWSWLSYDYDATVQVDEIVRSAQASLVPGDILVFHDNEKTKDRLKEVLPPILDFIEAKGWIAEGVD